MSVFKLYLLPTNWASFKFPFFFPVSTWFSQSAWTFALLKFWHVCYFPHKRLLQIRPSWVLTCYENFGKYGKPVSFVTPMTSWLEVTDTKMWLQATSSMLLVSKISGSGWLNAQLLPWSNFNWSKFSKVRHFMHPSMSFAPFLLPTSSALLPSLLFFLCLLHYTSLEQF